MSEDELSPQMKGKTFSVALSFEGGKKKVNLILQTIFFYYDCLLYTSDAADDIGQV